MGPLDNILSDYVKKIIDSFRICPICGYRGSFENYGVEKIRNNVRCPKCGSLERSRLCYLYLISEKKLHDGKKILSINPEQCIRSALIKNKDIEYNICGLNDVNQKMAEGQYDCIIANYVIDRASDDTSTLKQVHDLLNASGIALITVNMHDKEDLHSIPRKYDSSYPKMVSKIGFNVKTILSQELLTPSLACIFGISPKDYLMVASKNE